MFSKTASKLPKKELGFKTEYYWILLTGDTGTTELDVEYWKCKLVGQGEEILHTYKTFDYYF